MDKLTETMLKLYNKEEAYYQRIDAYEKLIREEMNKIFPMWFAEVDLNEIRITFKGQLKNAPIDEIIEFLKIDSYTIKQTNTLVFNATKCKNYLFFVFWDMNVRQSYLRKEIHLINKLFHQLLFRGAKVNNEDIFLDYNREERTVIINISSKAILRGKLQKFFPKTTIQFAHGSYIITVKEC